MMVATNKRLHLRVRDRERERERIQEDIKLGRWLMTNFFGGE